MTQTVQVYSIQAKCLTQDGEPWHLPGPDDTAEEGERLTLHLTARRLSRAEDAPAVNCEVLSGFKPVKSSLDALVAAGLVVVYDVDETDPLNQQLTLYLNEIGDTSTEFAFQIECAHAVHNLKPATITISESYSSHISDSTTYPTV